MLLAAVAVEAVIMMGAEELKMRDINMLENDIVNVSCIEFPDGPLCSVPEINASIDTDTVWNITTSKYLINDTGVLDVNETVLNSSVDDRLTSTYYNATESGLVAGTSAGSLDYTQHTDAIYDAVTFNLTEEAGSPGLDARMNFTGVEGFNQGVIRYKTSSLAGAAPIIQVWNYDISVWEDYPSLVQSLSYATITQPVFDNSVHFDGGVVQMRLYKASNGNINNHYYIDWLAVSSGAGTPSGEEVDPIWDGEKSSVYGNITLLQAGDVWTQAPDITSKSSIGGGNVNVSGNITMVNETLKEYLRAFHSYNDGHQLGYLYTNIQSGIDYRMRLRTDGLRFYFESMGAGNHADFYMVPNAAENGYGLFQLTPAWNLSNRIQLFIGRDDSAKGGLIINADQDHDQQIAPNDNNAYDLGNPTRCFDNIHYYDLVDCGSPTDVLRDVEVIPLLEKYADAKLSTSTADYNLLTPDEFKTGDTGDCGNDLISTDEVINALVISVRDLNAKILLLEEKLK